MTLLREIRYNLLYSVSCFSCIFTQQQTSNGGYRAMTYWKNRYQNPQFNWAGAESGFEGCPCGETGTCGDPGMGE